MFVRPGLVGIVPEVPPLKRIKLPVVAERQLANGLRVVAAKRSGVPRVEVRLLVPSARNRAAADPAQSRVMTKTLLSGTATRTSTEIAQELQRLGGHLDAGADSEDFVFSGSALATELGPLLGLVGEILTGATHPDEEVAIQRD
ncbi:MAG: insulinase family protein, partial [Actinobacteria bacterium]|nr:insulinase family protein [Actinomycetota bacterium]